jgi:acyl carrier protein
MSTDPTATITRQVITTIRNALSLPAVPIAESTRLVEDLDVDSLDLMEAIIDLEEEFDVEFPADAADRMRTVGNVVAFLRDGSAM